MLKIRIAFFGTSGWLLTSMHLERFIKRKANLVVLVSSPEGVIKSTVQNQGSAENLKEASERLDIPLLLAENIGSDEFKFKLKQYRPDVIVVCGFPLFIPGAVRRIAPLGAVNFHSSLLPRHAGKHPGFWTIWYGDKTSGMTVHFMDEGIDTGDIIYTSKVSVCSGDSIDLLYSRIWESSLKLVDRLLEDFESRSIKAKPQDMSEYIYNYDITDKDFELDFRQPAEILADRIGMLSGKFYFILEGNRYYVNRCRIIDEPLKTRKFRLNIPYLVDDAVFFVTPRKCLVIEEVIKDEKLINPKNLVKAESFYANL